MSPYKGGAIIPGEEDEYEDYLYANPQGGTIPAKRNKRTGHIVFNQGGTINPGYRVLILPDNPGPINFTETIADFRQVVEYLDPRDSYDVDQACVEWAALDKSRGKTLETFLSEKFGLDSGFLVMPISTFKKQLQKAYRKGLIDKGPNNRWVPKSGT